MSIHPTQPRRRWHLAPTVLAVAVMLTGCATNHAAIDGSAAAAHPTQAPSPSPWPTEPATTSAAPSASSVEQPNPARLATPGMSMAPATSSGVPSATAQMICSSDVRDSIAAMLQLSTGPKSTSSYVDHLYTCTYHLSAGPLVISVQDTTGVPAARSYFDSLRQQLPGSQTLTGLPALGLPAFQTPTGTVVFLKDDKTLKVDATALPAQVGPNRQTRTDAAYQIATDIIGCWRGQ